MPPQNYPKKAISFHLGFNWRTRMDARLGKRNRMHLKYNIDVTRMLLGDHSINTGGEGTITNTPGPE